MGRVVVSEFVSLDGVMEGPGPDDPYAHAGWTFQFQDPVGMRYKLEEVLSHEALLLGRVTYEGFAKAWPGRIDEVGFADKMNAMPKYVVSSTLAHADWSNSTILSGELPTAIGRLKEESSGDILVAGSCRLVQGLLAEGLVDELRLMVFPIVLGSGKRLFGESRDPLSLELASSTRLQSGAVILTYHPAGR
jgi:dihydrofolate reductase